jgi:hypothetical protein
MTFFSVVSGAVGTALFCAILGAATARAESPYERDQREQLEKYQRDHGLSPQVQQRLRWEDEWRRQHPGEPVPNLGVLEKLHRDEITAEIRQSGAAMWAARQVKLQHDYQMSRQHQEQINAAQHLTWTAQQWANWNRDYDRGQQQAAQDYLKAAALSGQMAREEAAREEQEKYWKKSNP